MPNGEEPQQYQTPDYEQQPLVEYAVEEEAPRKFEVRTLAIVIGAIILVVIIIIGAFMIVRSLQRQSRVDQYEQEVTASAEARLADDLLECESVEDPEACEARVVRREASKMSALSICDMLEEDAFVDCVESVARERSQPDDCDVIEDNETRDVCYDRVSLPILIAERDYLGCAELRDPDYVTSCQNQIKPYILTAGTCNDYGIDQHWCETQEFIDEAVAQANPDRCFELPEEFQIWCQEMVGVKDLDLDGASAEREAELGMDDSDPDIDNDGLLDGEELSLGTDPFNPDSDGDGLTDGEEVNVYGTLPLLADTDEDGFSDGQEVSGGYNPFGPGIL